MGSVNTKEASSEMVPVNIMITKEVKDRLQEQQEMGLKAVREELERERQEIAEKERLEKFERDRLQIMEERLEKIETERLGKMEERLRDVEDARDEMLKNHQPDSDNNQNHNEKEPEPETPLYDEDTINYLDAKEVAKDVDGRLEKVGDEYKDFLHPPMEPGAPCQTLTTKIARCYKRNPDELLKCKPVVREFAECTNKSVVDYLAADMSDSDKRKLKLKEEKMKRKEEKRRRRRIFV